ncbi:uncharacterized protein LOC133180985 [Saccostrea echinata]|uniref:uncharacterized protein LOC133180985 n=1 Tax=Saccostrea echinata TaxID=191078 RepID=UPI002A839B6B|nr:uncharacterized protein LOC133180985 [Saccostrea echinata]
MNDTYEYVEFPSEKSCWPNIQDLLKELELLSTQEPCDLYQLALHHQKIVDTFNGDDEEPREANIEETTFHGLLKFFQHDSTEEEKVLFLQSTLPKIISLALDIEKFATDKVLPISSQHRAGDQLLNRHFVASIIAAAFLCLFDGRETTRFYNSKLNSTSFANFFKLLPSPSQNAKLQCFLNYFERVGGNPCSVQGDIRFHRQVIPYEELPTIDTWLNSDCDLCPFSVQHEGQIEDSVPEAIEVDFANKYIGGGVLGRGRVQEEIRFTVCPELLSSMLFMEHMDDNEAIIIQGYEQFSETAGYGPSLTYAGNHQDCPKIDENRVLQNTLCAIDAVSFRNCSPSKQYQDHYYLRDLNKAFVGFSAKCGKSCIDTKNQSEETTVSICNKPCDLLIANSEEYQTASEDGNSDTENYTQELHGITNMVDGLVTRILYSAIQEACSQHGFERSDSHSSCEDRSSSSSFLRRQEDLDESQDQADLECQDWVSRFRRRSSNLSDIGSRRSSGSTWHSSDFSSELEEYYENYQRRDQSIIQKTITEEEGCPVICDFANSLAMSLIQESTAVAAQKSVVKDFDDSAPEVCIMKPKAYKPETEENLPRTNCFSPIIPESIARKFANEFISELFPSAFSTLSNLTSEKCSDKKSSLPDIPLVREPDVNSDSDEDCDMNNCDTYLGGYYPGSIVEDNYPLVDEAELRIAAVNLVDCAIHSAVQIVQESLGPPSQSKTLEDSDLNVSNPVTDSSSEKEDNLSVLSNSFGKRWDQSSSPSKSPKNVQFHDTVILNKNSDAVSKTMSESSNSQDSFTVPTLLVTDDLSQSDKLSGAYSQIAENIIMSGFTDALKDVQKETGKSFEGSTLKFSASGYLPEKTLIVKGNSLIHPGEILRGESYEDISGSNVIECCASSLSRDLLTNAFIEVQQSSGINGSSFARRSSEPMKLSSQAARQLLEDNKKGVRRYTEKSKSCTEDDLVEYARELDRRWIIEDFHERGPCGFKDPTLSRFAEELMKTECRIPPLHIPMSSTSVCSLSGSSTSFHSSKSGFKDLMLSSFEEELLSSSFGRSSTKSSSIKRKRKKSTGSRIRGGDFRQAPPFLELSQETISDFADRLAQGIILESIETVLRGSISSGFAQRDVPFTTSSPIPDSLLNLADSISSQVVEDAILTAVEELKMQKQTEDSSDTDSTSTEEYSDALDVPCYRIEEFADILAKQVLDTSVKFIIREMECFKKKASGRPVATGNWGCGAFRGDVHLKCMLQWMAASYAGVPHLIYYTFHHEDLQQLEEVVATVLSRNWCVGQLMQAVRTYCMACTDSPRRSRPDLFQLLLDKDSFKDIV